MDSKFTVAVSRGSRELTAYEKMAAKRYGDGEKVEPGATYDVTWWAIVDVHNEYSLQNQDYTVCVIGTEEGSFYTASEAFTKTLEEMWEQARDTAADNNEDYAAIRIRVSQKQSKKDTKKKFLVASFVKAIPCQP